MKRDENDIYLFVDGEERDSGTTTWTGVGTSKIGLGRYYNGGWSSFHDGLMDEVKIST